MALTMRVVCDEECKGSKGDGDEGRGQAMATRLSVTATAMATAMTWAMATATRWVGNKEGKGSNCNGDECGR